MLKEKKKGEIDLKSCHYKSMLSLVERAVTHLQSSHCLESSLFLALQCLCEICVLKALSELLVHS